MLQASETAAPDVDPELTALPTPRRPFRNLTLVTLAATALSSLALAFSLREPVRFALVSGPPIDLGDIGRFPLDASIANRWVHVRGGVGPLAAEYHRPLDSDTYRLVPALGEPRLFIELRIPKDLPAEHYLPPGSFVGRLVPLVRAGPERAGLAEAAAASFGSPLPADSWILEDGTTPAATRWAVGLVALLLGFFGFSVWGLVRLLAPRKSQDHPAPSVG